MRFYPFFIICYAVAVYGLALEYLYPFNSLPFAISISDELQESLKFQSMIVNYFSAFASLSFLVWFFYSMVLIITVHGVIRIVMRYRPAFREKVEKRIADSETTLKAQNNNKKPSSRALWGSLTCNILFSVAMVINDAIFNRSEDAASLKDGTIERFNYVYNNVTRIVYAQMDRHEHYTARAVSNVPWLTRRVPYYPVKWRKVEVEGANGEFVLEEKLIDFSDGMAGLYEKTGALSYNSTGLAVVQKNEDELGWNVEIKRYGAPTADASFTIHILLRIQNYGDRWIQAKELAEFLLYLVLVPALDYIFAMKLDCGQASLLTQWYPTVPVNISAMMDHNRNVQRQEAFESGCWSSAISHQVLSLNYYVSSPAVH
ncbi:hypothetical protein BT96DRAFT_937323 [Gymnopus androsaceus JB14]|uniref:Uncharacterized protein n=1 Tax=Gymnopus androsaceus JB14 TaxID=1447944 RepID=A0A6A4HWA6_9AGAR|nr:hypothetical protein BT96DRAFT_937323 [Gymnopus androsaceus JB14]